MTKYAMYRRFSEDGLSGGQKLSFSRSFFYSKVLVISDANVSINGSRAD